MDLLRRETVACLQASDGASLIVFNLFTLEGYFVAQYLNVPCLAASPFIQTRYSVGRGHKVWTRLETSLIGQGQN